MLLIIIVLEFQLVDGHRRLRESESLNGGKGTERRYFAHPVSSLHIFRTGDDFRSVEAASVGIKSHDS